jgi:hypothetical protein
MAAQTLSTQVGHSKRLPLEPRLRVACCFSLVGALPRPATHGVSEPVLGCALSSLAACAASYRSFGTFNAHYVGRWQQTSRSAPVQPCASRFWVFASIWGGWLRRKLEYCRLLVFLYGFCTCTGRKWLPSRCIPSGPNGREWLEAQLAVACDLRHQPLTRLRQCIRSRCEKY